MSKSKKTEDLQDLFRMLETETDPIRLKKMLENRGRQCISKTYIKKVRDALKNARNTEEFLDNLGKTLRLLKREGDKVYLVYPRCYCHKIKAFQGPIPENYCLCSVGWAREMFEQALGRPVEVELESSVVRGDKSCRMRIMI